VNIDWSRMARPQRDGYDTEVVLRLVSTEVTPRRPRPYRRAPIDGAVALFDGRVAVRNRDSGGLAGPRYAAASPNHPNLARAERLLGSWPEVAAQFPDLIDTIQIWTDSTKSPEQWQSTVGSSSHSLENEFGTIMATVDSDVGLTLAMVHEMAHHKLRAMGVSLAEADRLVTNNPKELYFSPIVNRKRPMMAVLHAQYSFIHVVCMECAIYMAEANSIQEKARAIALLPGHVAKMEEGWRQIIGNVRTDAEGVAFMEEFMSWSRLALYKAREILLAEDRQSNPNTRSLAVR